MRNKGFSLVELMIVVAIFGIIFLSCASAVGGGFGCSTYQDGASSAARSWANSQGLPSNANVTCVNRDSDGDGYVSCTIGIPGDQPTFIPLECQIWSLIGDPSCRMQKPAGSWLSR